MRQPQGQTRHPLAVRCILSERHLDYDEGHAI